MAAIKNNNNIVITSTPSAGYGHVHIIQKITSSTETIVNSVIGDSSTFPTTVDGYYIVTEIILPTADGGSYFIDGDEIKLGTASVILSDLLDLVAAETTTELVLYYYLNIYYINLIKSKLLKNLCSCACMSLSDKLTLDTLTMGLTIIPILEADSQFVEMGRMVDQLSVCTGITNTGCACYG
jgi:hypothetical protein